MTINYVISLILLDPSEKYYEIDVTLTLSLIKEHINCEECLFPPHLILKRYSQTYLSYYSVSLFRLFLRILALPFAACTHFKKSSFIAATHDNLIKVTI